ncbi:hypothetical protein A3H04_02010 [Candidatus Giovannonibacteria bacterium RIFCSPLOWO2_12_FULL_43_11c]|nr:MAG: hypothetical protein A3H04_02010 [Candidatus Giovannonibacteria bacterium RIFCSPLOWO2_12_FULL_43_11c]
MFLYGCSAAGFRPMSDEWHILPDGSRINAFQAKNSGISGPDVTAIETWRCPRAGDCGKVSSYSGSAPGAVEVGVAGMGAAAVAAGGNVGAAALLRPTRINSSTNVTGVEGGIRNENEQEQKAEGGSGGKGGISNAQGGNATGGSTGPVNVKAEGGKGGSVAKDAVNVSQKTETGDVKVDGAKIIGSGNSTNYNSSGSYSNSNSSAANYNSNYNSNSNKNVGGPVDVDVKVQPGQSDGKHGHHGKGWD